MDLLCDTVRRVSKSIAADRKLREKGKSGPDHTPSDPTPFAYQDNDNPTGSALSNPQILDSIFGNLDLSSLKSCREVCKTWSRIARSLVYSNSLIYLHDPSHSWLDIPEDEPLPVSVEGRLVDLKGVKLRPGVSYKIGMMEPKLTYVLDKIKGNVESLELHMDPDKKDSFKGGPFCHVRFPHLKTLRLEYLNAERKRWGWPPNEDKDKPNTLLFLDIIRRSPNLQNLYLPLDNKELTSKFFNYLLGPEGLPANERLTQTLESLRIRSDDLSNENLETFQKMKLKLKSLTLEIAGQRNGGFPALVLWLANLSSTLESLEMFGRYSRSKGGVTLEFPREMTKLTTLYIQRPELLGVDDIIPLLKQIPNLKTLTLTHEDSSQYIIDDTSPCVFIAETFEGFSFPNLTELNIWTEGDEVTKGICPLSKIPKWFPKLRKLSMEVYSKESLLACIYYLKGMQIEELHLRCKNLPNERERDGYSGNWHFASWKKLRKLSLSFANCSDCKQQTCKLHISVTKIYDMALESILPSGLTSLKIDGLGQIEAHFLIKLLQGMPLLAHLDLSNGYVVNGYRSSMRRSAFMKQIGRDPSINPYLHITKVFEPESMGVEDSNGEENFLGDEGLLGRVSGEED